MAEEPCYRMVPERVDGVWLRWCVGYLAGYQGITRSLSAASLRACQPANLPSALVPVGGLRQKRLRARLRRVRVGSVYLA
jgi:hypothetical protein